MREIAGLIGVTPVDLPMQSKYGADYLIVRQLEAMGQWAAAIKTAVTPAEQPAIVDNGIEVSADPTPKTRARKKAE